MLVLRRHQLVGLSQAGWDDIQARPWDDMARACLAHWAAMCLPLVVTQQRAGLPDGVVVLGLAAPIRWQRRKFVLQVQRRHLRHSCEFPAASAVATLLLPATRHDWLGLCEKLAYLGSTARVYGSHGWQHLTGFDYLHVASDIDLHLAVSGPAMADAIAGVLDSVVFGGPRLDGELVFTDGAAVAWREWLQWRRGNVDCILVKRLSGPALENSDGWLALKTSLSC
jgi:phosphoribosyl-dephospho-CoA transferase